MSQGLDGIARWKRIADDLRATIAAMPAPASGVETLRLPPEAELAARFGANRHTVRRAIAALAAEGIVSAERGRGTFVRAMPRRLAYPVGAHTRFTENVSKSARQPAGRLIAADRETAGTALAATLAVPRGTMLVRLETLHVADGVPLSVATSWFVEDRFPRIVAAYAETGSISKALVAHGIDDYHRRQTTITAERVTPIDAGHLGCGADAVVLSTQSANYDTAETPIQFSKSRFLAERVELVFDN